MSLSELLWERNHRFLHETRPDMARECMQRGKSTWGNPLKGPEEQSNLFVPTSQGPDILFHDNSEPWTEVRNQHRECVNTETRGAVSIIGMGLGYLPLALLSDRRMLRYILIFEPIWDVFLRAMELMDLRPLIQSPKVHFFIGTTEPDIISLGERLERTVSHEDSSFLKHVPSFKLKPDVYEKLFQHVFGTVNKLNVSGATMKKHGMEFAANTLTNLALSDHAYPIDELYERFKGMPAVLVGAGPSLDLSLPALRKMRDRALLIAADSALAPLRDAEITPHIVTSIDFQAINREKLAPFFPLRNLDCLLIAYLQGTPDVQRLFPAADLVWALQKSPNQQWVRPAMESSLSIPGALSVAHLSCLAALAFGADPIIFIGQDLAYTEESRDHAGGTILHQKQGGPPPDREVQKVQGVRGDPVITDRVFISQKTYFEDLIRSHPGRTYVNATAHGVHIEGTKPADLEQALMDFSDRSRDFWLLSKGGEDREADVLSRLSRLVPVMQQALKDSGQVLGKLKKLRKTISKASKQVRKIRKIPDGRRQSKVKSFEQLPGALQKLSREIDRSNLAIEARGPVWARVYELLFPHLKKADRWEEDNKQMKEERPYPEWLVQELARLDYLQEIRADALRTFLHDLKPTLAHLERVLDVRKKLHSDPENPEDLQSLFLGYAEIEAWALVRKTGDRLLAAGLENPQVYSLMGQACAHLLDFEEAEALWKQALSMDPERNADIRALREQMAKYWLDLTDHWFDQYPHMARTFLCRANRLAQGPDRIQDAAACLWTRIEEKANALKGKDLEHALSWLEEWRHHPDIETLIPELTPMWAAFMAKKAQDQLEAGRFDQGLQCLSQAASADSKTATLYIEIGDLLFDRKDYPGAAQAYGECLQYLPELHEVKCKLGDCRLLAGDLAGARVHYNTVLEVVPGHETATARINTLEKTEHTLGLSDYHGGKGP